MKGGLLAMSTQEVERATVIRQVIEKRLKQTEAAKLLKITPRQVRRLKQAYRQFGAEGLVSKHRGRAANNRHGAEVKAFVKKLIASQYYDFGPTFASEKLQERHKIVVNKETLRQWMIEWELWKPKRQKAARIHQSRIRRACFGELVQIDGSHHDWFEGRAAACCLLVFIDDATSRLVGLHFEESETTAGYFKLSRAHIEKYGRPLAYYSDKFGVFRVNHRGCEDSETQFGRAMRELDIELICADSAQAKGRVERANKTLQDRLIKEMRLRGLNSIEAANAYAVEFIKSWNQRFAVEAQSDMDAHRKELPNDEEMNLVFSIQKMRTLSKNLELSYENIIYQVQTKTTGYRLRHAKVTVCEDLSGKVTLLYKGQVLHYKQLLKQQRVPDVIDKKQIAKKITQIKKRYKPGADHPWKRSYQIECTRGI